MPSDMRQWRRSRVGEEFHITAGIALGPHRRPRRGAVPYLRVANVQRGRIDLTDIALMQASSAEERHYATAIGDLLIVEGHANPGEIGRCAIVEQEAAGILFQNHLFRLRPRVLTPHFAVAWLNSLFAQNYWHRMCATSSGLYTINSGQLAQMPISIPPLPEQLKIADILKSIDASIRAAERQVAKLAAARAAIASDLLECGPRETATDAPRSAYRRTTLGSVADIAGGVTLGRKLSGYGAVELPYLRVANVQDGHIDTANMKTVTVLRNEVERYSLRRGDFLMTEGGDFDKLGRGAVWDGSVEPCLHQNHIFRVRTDRALLLPEYLAIYTGSHEARRYFVSASKQTTNLATINMKQVRSFPVPVPSLAQQEVTIRFVSGFDERIRASAANVIKLRNVKEGLVTDLLTGRVRVKDVEGIAG